MLTNVPLVLKCRPRLTYNSTFFNDLLHMSENVLPNSVTHAGENFPRGSSHRDGGIDEQLDLLRDRILLLGGKTEAAVAGAMRALTERDSKLAREVAEDNKIIDQMELEIDR